MTYYKAVRPDGTSFYDPGFQWLPESRTVAAHAVRNAAWGAAVNAARNAAWAAVGDAVTIATWAVAGNAARCAAINAARALVVRDLIGTECYDTLTFPWRAAIGPIYPGDLVNN